MKKLTSICLSLILVLASAVLCFADGLYEVDAQSGQIVGTRTGDGEELVGYVRLSPNCAYDMNTSTYIYTGMGATGVEFSSNVYNGMYTNDLVKLHSDATAQLRVYLNGEELEYDGEGEFNTPGSYIVRDKGNVMILGFTILDDITNAVNVYELPSVFFVDTATFNGEALPQFSNSVDMTQDGDYFVSYYGYDTGVNYRLYVTIDHTAPVLEISGVNEEGFARNAVELLNLESGSTVDITKDGNEYKFDSVLTETGDYDIIYTDEAGNSSVYSFTIRPYLDLNAWMVLLIVVLLLIGTAAFMIYSRTHMRVR